tara:strand:- start:79 stop:288 length:210 start_codon:yes stop_codon:yes gene_type:complete
MRYEEKAALQDNNKARIYAAKKKQNKQWVECLKCDKQFEQPKNDEVCIYCNNQDRQETIYLSEEMVKDE